MRHAAFDEEGDRNAMGISARIAWLVSILSRTESRYADRGRWHILTGVGAYVFIVLAEFLTSRDDHNSSSEMYAWPVSAFLGADLEHPVGVAKRNREG